MYCEMGFLKEIPPHAYEIFEKYYILFLIHWILDCDTMTETVNKGLKKFGVTVSKPVLALIAVIFGVLVIALPDLLQLIVGLYFIIQGVLLYTDYMETKKG